MNIIILAGGEGKRLFPLSNEENPKQFLKIFLKDSLLIQTVRRFVVMGIGLSTYVVTTEKYSQRTKQELAIFDLEFEKRVITEPARKNTAPAIAWCIKELITRKVLGLDDQIMIVPIDHMVSDEHRFVQLLLRAASAVTISEILSFGLCASYPSEAYGYIKKGKILSSYKYSVEKFIEKPTQEYAERLIKDNCLWNLGVYVFHVRTYLQELLRQQPVLYDMIIDATQDHSFYETIEAISVDHAVIVYAKNLTVYEISDIQWFDVGTWDGLYEFFKQKKSMYLQNDISMR